MRTRIARAGGFTLIEIAVAVGVVALLLGSILVPLTSQVQQRQISTTEKSLEEIKEALSGFAVANGYLPCPAKSATDGLEDRTAGVCTGNKRWGFVPWVTLGVTRADAWGHLFRYRVTLAYTTPFTLNSARDITVKTRAQNILPSPLVPLSNTNDIPVLVLSHGRNGYGAVNEQGIAQALPAGWPVKNLDENTNVNVLDATPTEFISRVPQAADTPGTGGEFDDLVTWLSPNILFNRMVAAGRLP